MQPQDLDELMKKYRPNKAREAYLRHQLDSLAHFLELARGQMVNDSVSLSQALTGMPHGSGNGDPTGKLATNLASGRVTEFVKEIQQEIDETRAALAALLPEIEMVEIALSALNEREREVFEMKMIDEFSWAEILGQMNERHNGSYSKRTLQRLFDRAVDKVYVVVA